MKRMDTCVFFGLGALLWTASACEMEVVADEGTGGAATGGAFGGTGGWVATGGVPTGGATTCYDPEFYEPLPGEAWSGNAATCPNEAPSDWACAIEEGTSCAWRVLEPQVGNAFYEECTCLYDAASGSNLWACSSLLPDGIPGPCPADVPVRESSCSGLRGVECIYPDGAECSCPDTADPLWDCTATAPTIPVAPAVDLSLSIAELTAAERESLCEWAQILEHGGPDFPDSPAATVGADGTTTNSGCTAGWGFWQLALVPTISPEQCVANLALSTCPATVAEWSDCLKALVAREPLPTLGCGHYLEQPGCSGTTMLANELCDTGSPSATENPCSIRVE